MQEISVPEWSEDPSELKVLQQGLLETIERDFGPPQRSNFAWVFRGKDGSIIAGVAGYCHWHWAYVGQVWVHEDQRGQRLAAQLLRHLETWAHQQKLAGIYIDTFDERVKKMYENLGYHCFGQIPNFPPGHQRYFLLRSLSATAEQNTEG